MNLRTRILVVLATLAVACGGDDSAPGAEEIPAGTYILRTINGGSLPVTISQDAMYKDEITASILNLGVDLRYIATTTHRETATGSAPVTTTGSDEGNYSVTGSTVSFVRKGTTQVFSGTLSGNTLTLPLPGLTFVYRK